MNKRIKETIESIDDNELLGVIVTAKMLEVSPAAIYKRIHCGRIKFKIVEETYKIPGFEIKRILNPRWDD